MLVHFYKSTATIQFLKETHLCLPSWLGCVKKVKSPINIDLSEMQLGGSTVQAHKGVAFELGSQLSNLLPIILSFYSLPFSTIKWE